MRMAATAVVITPKGHPLITNESMIQMSTIITIPIMIIPFPDLVKRSVRFQIISPISDMLRVLVLINNAILWKVEVSFCLYLFL